MDQVMCRGHAQIAAIFLLAVIAAGPASQPAPLPPSATEPSKIPMADLTNAPFHFHLKYPADWKAVDPPVNHQVISLQTVPIDPKNTAFGVIGLRVTRGSGEEADPELLKDVSGEMVNYAFNNGGKKVILKPDKLGDIPARRIVFDLEKPDGVSRVECVVAVRDSGIYVFTVAAPSDVFDKMQPGLREMLKSFELTE
jgi:hypothetical protein